MPTARVQRKASSPAVERLAPTTTEPSAEMLIASLMNVPPGRSPSPTIPPTAWYKNASVPLAVTPLPMITEPSAETPVASLEKAPPGKSPSPTIPFTASQRNASTTVEDERLEPTTTVPSADTC